MIRMIFAFAVLVGSLSFSSTGVAANYGEYCNQGGYITEWICGGIPSGPGWYRGNDGCYYRNTNRPCYQPPQPPPPPPPGPGPGPGPQPGGQYVRCESWGFRYTECYVSFGRIRRATLVRQYSRDACVAYQTFGAYPDRLWVDRGCAGEFFVEFF